MAFEKYVPPRARSASPKALIRPTGLISFDGNAVEAFNLSDAQYAVLFFDRTRKLVGVKLTDNAGEEGALKLSRRRRTVSVKSPDFFEEYGIEIHQPTRFDTSYDDAKNMIVINTKSIPRRRGRRAKPSS
ncbi:MAG: hypothetical protein GF393_12505 [Armatimonadia bacterium]|nr:hypothetical protein [Armatimonadia bacterium]